MRDGYFPYEVIAQKYFEGKGYKVEVPPKGKRLGFDFFASRDGVVYKVEVKHPGETFFLPQLNLLLGGELLVAVVDEKKGTVRLLTKEDIKKIQAVKVTPKFGVIWEKNSE